MISQDCLTEKRYHLQPGQSLAPLPRSYPSRPRPTQQDMMIKELTERTKHRTFYRKLQGATFPVIALLVVIGIVLMIFYYNKLVKEQMKPPDPCHDTCRIGLVTAKSNTLLRGLFTNAKNSILILASHPKQPFNNTQDGIAKFLPQSNLKVSLLLVGRRYESQGLIDRLAMNGVEVKENHDDRLLDSVVIVFSQLVIVDDRHVVITTQSQSIIEQAEVKVGVLIEDCQCLAAELVKLYKRCWGEDRLVAVVGHTSLSQAYYLSSNISRPISLTRSRHPTAIALSHSLKWPHNDSNELKTILDIISSSKLWIYLSLASYRPSYSSAQNRRFWSNIDDVLRRKVFEARNISIKILLHEDFPGTEDDSRNLYLESLSCLSDDIRWRIFQPEKAENADESQALQFIVTDGHFLIGPTEMEGDYFLTPHIGMALVGNYSLHAPSMLDNTTQSNIGVQLQQHFEQMWNDSLSID